MFAEMFIWTYVEPAQSIRDQDRVPIKQPWPKLNYLQTSDISHTLYTISRQ